MDAAGIFEYEKVHVVNINNGNHLETYCIAGERGFGIICLNGAAARCAQVDDKVIIMAYCRMIQQEAKKHQPFVVFVDEKNKIEKITRYEKHGRLRIDTTD